MKDSTLLWTALVTGTIGIVVLFVLFQTTPVPERKLSEVEQLEDYEDVRVLAVVRDVNRYGNLTFLTLQKTEIVEAIAYDPINVTEGSTIEVTGSVSEYEGEKQIVLERVVVKG